MKKFLALLLTLVMVFTIAAPVYATADTDAVEETIKTEVTDVLSFFERLYNDIHNLLHQLVRTFGFRCPFCKKCIIVVSPANIVEALDDANEGDIIELKAGDYGKVELGELEGVIIDALGEANVGFVTTAETDITDVTITGLNLSIPDNSAINALLINGDAAIENLVITNSTFTGAGSKAGRAIYGTNPNATITITNCTFDNMGYPIYTMSNNGGFAGLTVDSCTFSYIKSWTIMPQYGTFSGDLTVTNNTFTNCTGGLVKSGAIAEGHTFTFANNTIINSTEHPSKNWFDVNAKAGTAIVEGNTRDGVEWIPGASEKLLTA